jgi:hypothetical protein
MRLGKKIWLLFTLFWLGLVLIQSTVLLDYYATVFLVAGLLILLVSASLVAVALGFKSGRFQWAGWLVMGWMAVLVTFPVSGVLSSALRKSGMRQAGPLIRALEDFKKSRGQYPERLDELMPAFLSELPPAAMLGTAPYQFHRKDDLFTLWFQLPDWNRCNYNPAPGTWTVHD